MAGPEHADLPPAPAFGFGAAQHRAAAPAASQPRPQHRGGFDPPIADRTGVQQVQSRFGKLFVNRFVRWRPFALSDSEASPVLVPLRMVAPAQVVGSVLVQGGSSETERVSGCSGAAEGFSGVQKRGGLRKLEEPASKPRSAYCWHPGAQGGSSVTLLSPPSLHARETLAQRKQHPDSLSLTRGPTTIPAATT